MYVYRLESEVNTMEQIKELLEKVIRFIIDMLYSMGIELDYDKLFPTKTTEAE